MEDSMHELEIAKMSHDIAKDLEIMTKADNDSAESEKVKSLVRQHPSNEQSPDTEVGRRLVKSFL